MKQLQLGYGTKFHLAALTGNVKVLRDVVDQVHKMNKEDLEAFLVEIFVLDYDPSDAVQPKSDSYCCFLPRLCAKLEKKVAEFEAGQK